MVVNVAFVVCFQAPVKVLVDFACFIRTLFEIAGFRFYWGV